MPKTKLVVFTKNNARVIVNPTRHQLKTYPNALLDPDLTQVKKTPPHFWKTNDRGELVPMTTHEQKARLEHIRRYGLDNQIVSRGTLTLVVERASTFVKEIVQFVLWLSIVSGLWVAVWWAHKNNWQPFKDLADLFK